MADIKKKKMADTTLFWSLYQHVHKKKCFKETLASKGWNYKARNILDERLFFKMPLRCTHSWK